MDEIVDDRWPHAWLVAEQDDHGFELAGGVGPLERREAHLDGARQPAPGIRVVDAVLAAPGHGRLDRVCSVTQHDHRDGGSAGRGGVEHVLEDRPVRRAWRAAWGRRSVSTRRPRAPGRRSAPVSLAGLDGPQPQRDDQARRRVRLREAHHLVVDQADGDGGLDHVHVPERRRAALAGDHPDGSVRPQSRREEPADGPSSSIESAPRKTRSVSGAGSPSVTSSVRSASRARSERSGTSMMATRAPGLTPSLSTRGRV